MTDSKEDKAHAWNIWSKPVAKVPKAAPVVLFDESSRKEYVTGFGKRKMQRKMVAQAAIKMKEKQMRAQERINRKRETEAYVEAIVQMKTQLGDKEGDYIKGEEEEGLEGQSEKNEKLGAEFAKLGSKNVYSTEDGSVVTATVEVMDFKDEEPEEKGTGKEMKPKKEQRKTLMEQLHPETNASDSDSDEMPALIPVHRNPSPFISSLESTSSLKKPKLRGNTSNVFGNIGKKRKSNFQDRNGSNKKRKN